MKGLTQRFESVNQAGLVAISPSVEQDYRFFDRIFRNLKTRLERLFFSSETGCLIVGFLLGRALILSSMSPFIIPFFATMFALKKKKRGLAFLSLFVGASSVSISHGSFALFAMLCFMAIRWLTSRWTKDQFINTLPYLVFSSSFVTRSSISYITDRQWLWSNEMLALTEASLSFLLTLIFLQSVPLLSVNLRKHVLKNEEIICFVIMLASVLTGTIGWQFYGFSMEHILSRYVVLLFGYVGGAAIGSTVGVVIGLILSLANVTSLYQMSLLAFSGLLGGLLREGKKIGVSIGLMIGTLLIGLYGGGYEHLLGTAGDSLVAILLFLLTPRSVTRKLATYIPGTKEYSAEQQQYVKRLRDVTADRVAQFSSLFQTLSNSFQGHDEEESDHEVDVFLSNVTEKTCQTCFLKEACWARKFDQTYDLMTRIMEETGDKPTLTNSKLKREWQHHCIKPEKVVKAIHEQQLFYHEHVKLKKKMKESRLLVAEQLKGVSQVMGDFAKEIQRERDTHQFQEEQILLKLQDIGFDVENVEIYSLDEGAVDIEMTLPSNYYGECEKLIAPILSDVLGENIIVERECKSDFPRVQCKVAFGSAKKYTIETGVAHTAKGGGYVSGDNYTTFGLGAGKYAIAISDGMGNGERASSESHETLKLLSKVLKSGINETVAIKSINSILSLRSNEEIFSTLDLAMIDLQDAKVKFLKIGSNPSFVKRGDHITMIEAGNLPMGMIENVEIDVASEQLKAGDLLVMMSDGIFEAPKHVENKEAWVKRKIRDMQTDDPQAIADLLLEEVIRANSGEIDDDMTIVVSKIKHHTPKWSAISTYSMGEGIDRKAQ